MRSFIVVGVVSLLLVGCGSDGDGGQVCSGPGSAPAVGVTLAAGAESFSYGRFRWGANNDCPAVNGVVSVTITGEQQGAAEDGFGMGFCLLRPDLVDQMALSLSDATQVDFTGASARDTAGCSYIHSASQPVTGTVSFSGFCTEAGQSWAMTLAGSVTTTKLCIGEADETVSLTLGGTVAVTAR